MTAASADVSANLREDPAVTRFVSAARAFCGLVEPGNALEPAIWRRAVVSALADLYAAGLRLPTPDLEGAPELPRGAYENSPEQSQISYATVASKLRTTLYWEFFDPVRDAPEAPVSGDLADDLRDIYLDVAPGLRAWDEAPHEFAADIVFDWKEPLFALHWGRHAVSALRALHAAVVEADDPPDAAPPPAPA